jgi:hypothetical protein
MWKKSTYKQAPSTYRVFVPFILRNVGWSNYEARDVYLTCS